MLIRIPNKLTSFFVRRAPVLGVLLILVAILKSNTNLTPSTTENLPEIQVLAVSGATMAQFYADNREFICENNYLYVVLDNRIYLLVDSFGKEIICRDV